VPFTLRNIKEDLEDVGSRFDGAPDLEFRAATKALELEKSALSYQPVPPGYRFPYGHTHTHAFRVRPSRSRQVRPFAGQVRHTPARGGVARARSA
jgi:hypothetical protein